MGRNSLDLKMRLALPTVLGFVLLCLHTSTFGCDTNCCEKSTNCCEKSTDCCNTNCQTKNCCQKSTDCCNTDCQRKNCCQTTSTCCSQVKNCCNTCHVQCRNSTCTEQCKKDCCTRDTDCETEIDERIIDNKGGNQLQPSAAQNHNSNVNNNNHNISATIILTNTINNENRIFIPINVSSSNSNNVVVTYSGYRDSGKESTTVGPQPTDHTARTTKSSPTTPSSTTPCPTRTVKIPVPIPVPGETKLIPVPYPVPYPVPQPMAGCCVIMHPCVSYGCHSFHRHCGGECSHDFLYRPVDPCGGYCHKRQFGINRDCSWSGQCHHNWLDCSMCDTNFYESYDGYQQCGGCFYR